MASDLGNWREAAAAEYAERRSELVRARDLAAGRLQRLRERVGVLEAQIAELDQGAKVFGLIVETSPPTLFERPLGHGAPPPGIAPPQFKDLALQLLAEAYPRPLKAAQIQETIQNQLGRTFHWKTAGMTLYRLKTEGRVRREGQSWFFVPDGRDAGTGEPDAQLIAENNEEYGPDDF